MAALSDPRAFLSGQEKRAQQMKAMGIEETDINTKDVVSSDGSGAAKAKGEEEKKKGDSFFFFARNIQLVIQFVFTIQICQLIFDAFVIDQTS